MKISNKINLFKRNQKRIPKTDYSDDLMYYFRIYQGEKHSQRERPLLLGLEKEFKFCETRRFRFDFAYPHKKIAVECDGGQWLPNGGRHNRDSDREKLNIAASLGWTVFRYSGEQIKNEPLECCEQLYKTLYKGAFLDD